MITTEVEKQVALITSILDLGGRGRKSDVLDNIERREYLRLFPDDLEIKSNRNELVWRNDVAYTRHHLKLHGYVDGRIKNNWELTERGRKYFCELVSLVQSEPNLKRLTETGRARAILLAQRLREG